MGLIELAIFWAELAILWAELATFWAELAIETGLPVEAGWGRIIEAWNGDWGCWGWCIRGRNCNAGGWGKPGKLRSKWIIRLKLVNTYIIFSYQCICAIIIIYLWLPTVHKYTSLSGNFIYDIKTLKWLVSDLKTIFLYNSKKLTSATYIFVRCWDF